MVADGAADDLAMPRLPILACSVMRRGWTTPGSTTGGRWALRNAVPLLVSGAHDGVDAVTRLQDVWMSGAKA